MQVYCISLTVVRHLTGIFALTSTWQSHVEVKILPSLDRRMFLRWKNIS